MDTMTQNNVVWIKSPITKRIREIHQRMDELAGEFRVLRDGMEDVKVEHHNLTLELRRLRRQLQELEGDI